MKSVAVFLLVIFLLVGCSTKSNEVNGLIEEEKYSEAVKLINEYELLKEETKQDEYNYQNVILLSGLQDLFNEGEYDKLIKSYLENPIVDDKLNEKVHKLLGDSFKGIVEKDYLRLARESFDKLDNELQKSLEETNTIISNAEKAEKKEEERKRIEQEKANEKKVIQLLALMEEGNYTEIIGQTVSNTDNKISNFYNLASAYSSFKSEDMFMYGVQSMPEFYLKEIKSPSPEVQKYMDTLLTQIEDKKAGTASTQGVVIGMTKDQVLKSSWGKPQDVNKTVTAFGTSEQWVYPGFQFLYFEDDAEKVV